MMVRATAATDHISFVPAIEADEGTKVSVIIPVLHRSDDLVELYRSVAAELSRAEVAFEVLFVFDGSAAAVSSALRTATADDKRLRILRFDQTLGEATVLRAGFEGSRGDRIVTLAAYFQVQSGGMTGVLRALDDGADLVVTRRWPRSDGWLNRLQSKAFHWIVRRVSGITFRDMACGLRGMRRDVAHAIPLYGDLHRFIPALAIREGFRVVELDVPQHPLDAQPRLYGPGVYIRRLLDIITFFFLVKFTEKPLRFFGLVGTTLVAAGAVINVILFVQRLAGRAIADRPLLLLGALLLAIGIQLLGLGLVGEIIVHLRSPHRRSYRIRETV